jgi:hypothetical protein
MTDSLAPQRHDTKNPLTCCPRCFKAETLGRLRRRPVFRYDKVDAADGPATYDMYHGDQHVAILRRRGSSGSSYDVRVMSHSGDQDLVAETLRGARALAEETYIVSWREGAYTARGPVREI